MITPSYGLTATERVLPSFILDWTTGLAQDAVDVTRAGVSTFVGSNGLIQSAAENTQRVDYSTSIAGILVEESRTNLLPRSIPDAGVPTGWSVGFSTGTFSHTLVSAVGALSSFQNIIKNEQTTSGRSYLFFNLTLAANTTYVFKMYADKANSFVTSGGTAIVNILGFSDATGTFIKRVDQIDDDNTIILSFTTGSDTSGEIRIGPGSSSNSISTMIYGGWQLEAGAFSTSYIPTEATAVTRNADVATMTGTNFSDFFNTSAGTFFINTNARNADVLLTAGTYTLSADATALKKYATTYTADPSATELVFGKGTIQKVNYYKQALIAAELAAITA